MIEITFFLNGSGEITGFRSEGHAGYADKGEDIVCAAVSALIINTINAVDELTDDKMEVDSDEKKCCINVFFVGAPGKEARLLLNALALGLTNIEKDESAAEFIDVVFEEVLTC